MFIKEYISKDFPAFNTSDSIEEANEVAKEFGYSHVFVKKKGIYQGAISQSFLEDSAEGNLGSLAMHFEKFAILDDGNILDSIKLFHTFNANVGNGPTNASTNYWQQKPFMGNTAANDQSLCVNMYTSNISYWAVTNAFDLSAGDYEISFDYATTNGPFMTNPNGPAPQVEGGDKFKILVTTDNGATWQELRNWDNPNITISNERNKLTIDVSAYKSNNVKFAFYASDGTVFNSQANYRIFVDNFKVQLKSSMNVTESGKSNFTVFPNPTAGKISVKSEKNVKSLELYEISGKSLSTSATNELDLSKATKGSYILKATFSDNTTATKNVIKK
ncbi:MAG: T9SS type A sorting domain-containing protein [Chryseobacterium sp.]|nr:T9SS type A sorting domain-containing protein [Chryseobacterium sp.]